MATTENAGSQRADDAREEAFRSSTPRRRWLLVVVLAAGPLVAAAALSMVVSAVRGDGVPVLSEPDRNGPPRVVRDAGPAPAFTLPNIRAGEPDVTLATFRGQPVVLNFWASWCVPCRREMPVLAELHRRLGDQVAIVGVNHQDQQADAREFLDRMGAGYPSGFNPDGSVAREYGLFGIPTTLFISPEGEILEQRTGEMSRRQVEEAVTRLFGVAV